MTTPSSSISKTFLWRRIHSLMGLWLVIFLIEHLIVNSQAALWIGDDGIGFVRLVNLLEALPFLQVFEILLIGLPIAVHGYWGVKRALSAKTNVLPTDGSSPSLSYTRNKAFTLQRLTSWILLVGIVIHVVEMRFIEAPSEMKTEHGVFYSVEVSYDVGLESVAKRVGVTLQKISDTEVKVIAKSPGKAMLFTVRDTFKSLWICALYSIFVLAAAFHAFNGFWTSMITWGVMLSYKSQRAILPMCWVGVAVLAFLGLAAIWGSYWVNLRT